MRLRQVGACDQLWRTRIADIDRGKVLWRALMREPQDTAPVLGDLDRHALADPAKPVELVMCQLLEIPNRRFRHLGCLLFSRRGSNHSRRGTVKCGGLTVDGPAAAPILAGLGVVPCNSVCSFFPTSGPTRNRLRTIFVTRSPSPKNPKGSDFLTSASSSITFITTAGTAPTRCCFSPRPPSAPGARGW